MALAELEAAAENGDSGGDTARNADVSTKAVLQQPIAELAVKIVPTVTAQFSASQSSQSVTAHEAPNIEMVWCSHLVGNRPPK